MASNGVAAARVMAPQNGSVGEFFRFFEQVHTTLYDLDAFNGAYREASDDPSDGGLEGSPARVMEFLKRQGVNPNEMTPLQVLQELEERFGGHIPMNAEVH